MFRGPATLVSIVLLASISLAFASSPAQAADVNVTLIAKNIQWHVGTETSTQTTITVTVGDTLRLRIENRDSADHTFTAPQFPAATGQGGGGNFLDITLAPAQIFFWNYTTDSNDAGSWQFYCAVLGHSSGTYPNRTGMVGLLVVQSTAPPTPTTDSTLLIGGAVIVVAIIAVAAALMMRKRPKPPTQPPSQP